MFPLPILTYVKMAAAIAVLAFSWYLGYSFEASRFDRYKADQVLETQKLKDEHQAAADKIEKDKNDQINAINTQLANALVELRNRPSRSKSEASNAATCGTGLSLYAEDGSFLIREAARADTIRSALQACYEQYDSLDK
jgi:hypothetical protein